MTRAAHGKALEVRDVQQAIAALRAHGARLTPARRALLQALFAADGPVSADQLARGLAIDLATAYRNLEHLEALGVVRHVHIGHGPGLYARARDPEAEYLVCERCHRVEAADGDTLDRARAIIRETHGFEARFGHFPIGGVCSACRAAEAAR